MQSFNDMKCIFLILALLCVIPFGMIHAESNYVEMMDNIKKKDTTAKIFEVLGHITYNHANMTVTYPDESIVISSVSVTNMGNFQTFVMLNSNDPAGLYKVSIIPYNSTDISTSIDTSFFLSDYDGMVDIHIKRNSVLECDDTQYCMEPGITHIPKSFGVRFFNDDYDNHQIKIGSTLGDIILPGGDSIIYPQSTGVIEYGCIIHPWVDGKLQVSDVQLLVYVDDTINDIINDTINDSKTIPTHASDDGMIVGNSFQVSYDTSNCSTCYIGTVTKIIDGDTIHIDGKSVRLSLVNTPEKREDKYNDATNFVAQSCPVGSRVLVDVDDILQSDGLGVNFAKITCGDVIINESLMDNNLAKMYTTFCTQSEFMYESWATHDCKLETASSNVNIMLSDVTTDVTITNNTVPTNDTIVTKNITNDNSGIIYIIVVCIVIVICLILLFYKKNQSFQDKSFPNTIWLE